MNDRIRDLFIKLWRYEPFYGTVATSVVRRESRAIPTAEVSFEKKYYVLKYNPDFFDSLTDTEVIAVIKHELLHIVFGHPVREGRSNDPELWNMAEDLTINHFIGDDLPRNFKAPKGHEPFVPKYYDKVTGDLVEVTSLEQLDDVYMKLEKDPDQVLSSFIAGEGMWKETPTGKASEWYYQYLGDMRDRVSKMVLGMADVTGGGEDGEEMSPAERAFAQQMQEKILKSAVKNSQARGWGSISCPLKDRLIDLSNQQASVNWKQALKAFSSRITTSDMISSYRRLNKRYPNIAPGFLKTYTARIAVSIDQSGSVCDSMFAAFASELNNLSDFVEFTVIPFDSEVVEDEIFVWKKGQKFGSIQRVSCGGTDFDPPTKYVNDSGKFDGHILLTDMYAPKPMPSRVPRLWIVPDSCEGYFETHEPVLKIQDV
jgi:predicted metal-dependent peptidase